MTVAVFEQINEILKSPPSLKKSIEELKHIDGEYENCHDHHENEVKDCQEIEHDHEHDHEHND